MKFKKVIASIGILAMMMSTFTCLNVKAASLGGKPAVNAELVEYTTNSSKSWAKAWVKVTIDMSAAETLSDYEEKLVYDEVEEDDVLVKSGNGITTGGLQLKNNNPKFVPQATNTTIASNWVSKVDISENGYLASFGPKSVATEYYTEQTIQFIFNFKVTSADFSEKSTITLTGMTLDGKNQKDGVWAYKLDDVNLNIPSYNEWSAPTAEITGIKIDPTTTTVNGGETQKFTVNVEGTGEYDKTYTLTATAGTFDGDVFTAPAATDAEQTITITATANGDSTKTATATVTVPAKEPEKDFTFEAAADIYVGETKDAVKVFNCNINKADFSKMVVFTFTAGEETKSFNGVFSGFDGETGLKNFSVLMFNAPADLKLDSITQ